jgi:transcriptional antiterminator NusG
MEPSGSGTRLITAAMDTHPAWYGLHTRSRFEQVVFDGLYNKSLEAFLPKITVISKRRDRRKKIRVPLFPGYVFVRSDLNAHERLEIVKTVGVVRVIGNKDGPISIPDEAIDSLRIMVAGDNPVETGTRFRKGDRVMVVEGPFVGVVGTFVRYRGFGRVVVAMEALGQYAAVNVPEEHVERLPDIV